MKVLLDTNAYTRFANGHQPLTDVLEKADDIYMSSIVLGELFSGFRLGSRRKENLFVLQDFIDTTITATIDITPDIADRYSELFAFLRVNGTPIPTNDIWIAATALEYGARLISYDEHHKNLPGLIVLTP